MIFIIMPESAICTRGSFYRLKNPYLHKLKANSTQVLFMPIKWRFMWFSLCRYDLTIRHNCPIWLDFPALVQPRVSSSECHTWWAILIMKAKVTENVFYMHMIWPWAHRHRQTELSKAKLQTVRQTYWIFIFLNILSEYEWVMRHFKNEFGLLK